MSFIALLTGLKPLGVGRQPTALVITILHHTPKGGLLNLTYPLVDVSHQESWLIPQKNLKQKTIENILFL